MAIARAGLSAPLSEGENTTHLFQPKSYLPYTENRWDQGIIIQLRL